MALKKRVSLLLFYFFLSKAFAGDQQSVQAGFTPEGKVFLKNKFFFLVFDPQKGGRATEVVFLPWQQNLTAKEGFFTDSFREIGGAGKLFPFGFLYPDYPYQAEVISGSGEEAKVRFSLKLDNIDNQYRGWLFQRECCLKENSPYLFVTITVTNNSSERRAFAYRPSHLINFENETVWYYLPDISGILRDYDPPVGSDGRGSHGLYTLHPSAAWIGCLTAKTRRGLVCEFEWKYLDSLEAWISSRTGSVMQWFYRKFSLQPGQVWKTSYLIYPVEGLTSLDGASQGIAGGLTVGQMVDVNQPVAKEELIPGAKVPVKFQIYSPVPQKVTARLSSKQGNSTRFLKEETLTLSGLSPAEVSAEWRVPSVNQLVVLEAELIQNGPPFKTLERPLEIGRCLELYQARVPSEKQEGESAGFVHGRPPLPECVQKIDLSFVSPHERWAKPYC
ncbi:MAG: hypothetical protein NC823_02390, partial [Candidatus Omnitrophica bacterium]|nr:hypothetical protein [Candidatus Omnitrophota bacterium]